MSLTMLDKELAAADCRPCTDHHLAEMRRAGATEGMRRQALGLPPATAIAFAR